MIEFKLPAIGEGVVEAEIIRWIKQPGEAVATNEALVEVMTDKATVEIPSPRAGVVAEIHAAEGAMASVGQVICTLDESASTAAPKVVEAAPRVAAVAADVSVSSSQRVVAAAPVNESNGSPTRVLATPAARSLARETGIDLRQVPGQGGRITKSDVLAATSQPSAPAPSPSPAVARAPGTPSGAPAISPSTEPERVPFRGMRRRIADGLVKSYTTAVHYTYVDEVDVTKLVAVREQAKAAAAAEGVSLTYLPFIVKAAIRGLKKFPMVNATLDEAASEIVLHRHYGIGIATATAQGLMVPVVHAADRKSLLEIAAEIAVLGEAARTGHASREQLTGSTFTITSLGTVGGLHATPILNYPEVGILGVHAIRKVPVVGDDDQITIGRVMNLSVSLDHRIVDGFEGASFLQEIKRYLEDPTLLLLAGI